MASARVRRKPRKVHSDGDEDGGGDAGFGSMAEHDGQGAGEKPFGGHLRFANHARRAREEEPHKPSFMDALFSKGDGPRGETESAFSFNQGGDDGEDEAEQEESKAEDVASMRISDILKEEVDIYAAMADLLYEWAQHGSDGVEPLVTGLIREEYLNKAEVYERLYAILKEAAKEAEARERREGAPAGGTRSSARARGARGGHSRFHFGPA